MLQLSLIQESAIKKNIKTVSINQLSISEFNPRSDRSDEDIDRLAQRISRNGFEVTRAVWVYQNGTGFKIFAGGTRLEAARRAGCKTIPVVIHEGLTDDDIVKLAYEDNENDEYHTEMGIVETWANYAALAGQGWTQERIAAAVGVSRVMVSYRLNLHSLPEKIKTFVTQKFIDETHLREIMQLSLELHFAPWLTTLQAQEELAELAATGKTKNGKKTVRAVGDDVAGWREFITYAKDVYRSLQPTTLYNLSGNEPTPYTYDARAEFISELARRQARNLVEVKAAERAIRLTTADNLAAYERYIQHTSAEAAQQAMIARQEEELLSRFILGDCLKYASKLESGSVRLLLLDPPYGQNYQSNRRWNSDAPPKLINDTQAEAMELLRAILEAYKPTLAGDAHILVFCNWQNEPAMRSIIEQFFTIRGSLIWVKDEHSAGDLDSAFGPSHERIIHATQGRPMVRPRLRDVFQHSRELQWSHPTVKPLPLLNDLIKSCTVEGDLVIDPAAGIGSTLVAAQKCGRQFWGCEIENNYHQSGCARLLEGLKNGNTK